MRYSPFLVQIFFDLAVKRGFGTILARFWNSGIAQESCKLAGPLLTPRNQRGVGRERGESSLTLREGWPESTHSCEVFSGEEIVIPLVGRHFDKEYH
jgi:hypothetical protein